MASSADLAGVASSADLAEVASLAVAEVASSADLAEVASSADLAGFVTSRGKFKMECGDGVLVLSDCGCVCDDFAEVASLAGRAGGVPVCTVPPANADSTVAADRSYDKDTLFGEPEAIVVGAVSTGAPWFLTGWAEGTEVEFMIDTGCQVTILATSVFE